MPSYRRLASGNWQAGVFHPSGARYYKTDPLKKVVKDWAEVLELQIRRGTFVDPKGGKSTLEEWWVEWSNTRTVAAATASKAETHWRIYVGPAFGSWPLATIGRFDVLTWVGKAAAEKAKGKGGGEALATAVRLLVQLLDAAVEAKRIPINPAKGITAPTPPKHVDRFLDYEERGLLLEAVTMPDRSAPVPRGVKYPRVPDPANRLFVKLMLDAGLRWQEAAGQHIFRVDLRRKRLRVQEVVERKSRVIKLQPKSAAGSRWVPLTDELCTDLEEYLASHPTKDGLLFPAADGGTLDYANWLKRVWAPAVAAAGLADPQPTPHDCRHSYGSWLADDNVPPHVIKALMGHGSMRAVERYIHASESRMGRARDALYARTAHGPGSEQRKTPSP